MAEVTINEIWVSRFLDKSKKQMDVFIDMENALDQLLAMKKARLRQSGSSQKIAAIEKKLSNKKSVFSGMYAELKEGLLTQEEYTQTLLLFIRNIASVPKSSSEKPRLRT